MAMLLKTLQNTKQKHTLQTLSSEALSLNSNAVILSCRTPESFFSNLSVVDNATGRGLRLRKVWVARQYPSVIIVHFPKRKCSQGHAEFGIWGISYKFPSISDLTCVRHGFKAYENCFGADCVSGDVFPVTERPRHVEMHRLTNMYYATEDCSKFSYKI
jgi:hypothetical protein